MTKLILPTPMYGLSPLEAAYTTYSNGPATPEKVTIADVKAAMETCREILANPATFRNQHFEPSTKADELGLKCCAEILLRNPLKTIIVPDRSEWIGLNLLDRDG